MAGDSLAGSLGEVPAKDVAVIAKAASEEATKWLKKSVNTSGIYIPNGVASAGQLLEKRNYGRVARCLVTRMRQLELIIELN